MAENIKQKFNREKPHVNIGGIGHVDHGKTTLIAAITKYLSEHKEKGQAKFKAYGEIDKAPEEKTRGITISTSHVEIETSKRHYSWIDCPGHADYVKNMITGAAQMDGAILILSAQDGSKEQTKEHLLLAKQIGIEYLVVFLNKVDMVSDLEEIDLVKEEIKEDLRKAGYDAEKIPIIGGSALCALEGRNPEMGEEKISDLLDAIDNYIPTPQRNVDAPFKMYIKDIISITGQGTVVTGDVEQGVLKRGQEVEISGLGNETIKTVATSIEMHKKELEEARAGDDVGIKLRGVKKEQITRGQLLSVAIKGTKIKTYNKFFATAYILSREERGRHTNFRDGYRPQFYLAATDVTGTIELKDKSQEVAPGSTVEFTVNLIKPLAIEKNEKFIIREGGHTVGQGTILETLE